jgi:riboflavin kinase/FMN adenylyltransferase
VCALGTFDGVHLGHRAVLQAAIDRARDLNLQAVVFSFEGHPQHVLSQTPVPLLSTLQERLALFESIGCDGGGFDVAVVPPFTPQLMQITAAHFVSDILQAQLNVHHVVVGYDFHFGLHRQGDGALLQRLGQQSEPPFGVRIVQPVKLDHHQIISSTQIRKLLQYGDVSGAAALLGRSYSVTGQLMKGFGRARQLGYPTANIAVAPSRLMPAVGVYMGWLEIKASEHNETRSSAFTFPAVCNIGFSPTVLHGDDRPETPRLEVHALLDPGQVFPELPESTALTFTFVRRLRDEQKFPSLDALVSQIAHDCEQARLALKPLSLR